MYDEVWMGLRLFVHPFEDRAASHIVHLPAFLPARRLWSEAIVLYLAHLKNCEYRFLDLQLSRGSGIEISALGDTFRRLVRDKGGARLAPKCAINRSREKSISSQRNLPFRRIRRYPKSLPEQSHWNEELAKPNRERQFGYGDFNQDLDICRRDQRSRL